MSLLPKKIRVAFTVIGIFISDPKMFLSFFRNLRSLRKQKKNILISLTEHIGDIVAAEPISRYVREQHQNKAITWVVDKKYEELIRSNPAVDSVITVSCFSEWILLRKFSSSQNLYDLHLDKKVCDKHHLQYEKEAPAGIDNKNYYEKGNLLYCFSRSAGITMDVSVTPKLYLIRRIKQEFFPQIVIHTSSNNLKRDWTKEGWNELMKYLIGFFPDSKIAEIGFQRSIDTNAPNYINCCGNRKLSDIAELISECSLFIGVDSGFAHFANALEKESLILIGAYNGFTHYMPYSGKFQKECGSQIFYTSKELSQLKFEELKPVLENRLKLLKKEALTSE